MGICQWYNGFTKRISSAGGVVFDNQGQVLLTQNSANLYWGFPKGIVEDGKSLAETALMEVKEEGGVAAEILEKVGESKYVFTDKQTKGRVFKVVTIYLMRYLSGDPKDHDWEVSEAAWFKPDQALQKLSFKQDQELLKKALEIRKKNAHMEGGWC